VVVEFFDRPAATTSRLPRWLCGRRAGHPGLRPSSARGRYRLIYEHRWSRPPRILHALSEFTQRCTDVLEMYVRRHPELWLWMHRRWRDLEELPAPPMFPSGSADDSHGLDGGS